MQSSLKTGWLLLAVVVSGVGLSGCFDPPALPDYVTEMADLEDPNTTFEEYEANKAAAGNADAQASNDSDGTDDASVEEDTDQVTPDCVADLPCDSDDSNTCLDDITICDDGIELCVDRTELACEIDGVCVDSGTHNPENTCEVCNPGEDDANATRWTAIEAGKLCDERGLFGLCVMNGVGEAECLEQPDWLFCGIDVPPLNDEGQCVPFQPWGGTEDGDLRFVHGPSSDDPHCPNASVDKTLKEALEREPQALKWGSVIMLGDGAHEACDLVIPAGVTVRSISGAVATQIIAEPGGCDQAILRVEGGALVQGVSLGCDAQDGCADLTLLKLAGGDSEDPAIVSYSTFTGGKRGISTEVPSRLHNNTFYNGKSGVVVETAAADSEVTIHSSLFWSLSAHGISAEAAAVNVTAESNVYIKTSNPTKQITDDSATANGETISGAEFDTETYTAKDDTTLSKLVERGADDSDVGATQSNCGWDVRAAPFRCAHAVGTLNHCLGEDDEPLWLGQVDACAEVDTGEHGDLQEVLNATFSAAEPMSEELLLEPGLWDACNVEVPDGVFLIGAAGPANTVIQCTEPLPEACTSPAEGETRDCPESRVLSLGHQSGLVGVSVEVTDEALNGVMVPAIKVTGADVVIDHVLSSGNEQGIGIELNLPKVDVEGTEQPTAVTLNNLTLATYDRAIWVVAPHSEDDASSVLITLGQSVMSWNHIGIAYDEGVEVELATKNNHFCGIEAGAYVAFDDAGEGQVKALDAAENEIQANCPEDWDYTEAEAFIGAGEAGHDLGAVQVSCDWYAVEVPASSCCYAHSEGSCIGSDGATACAETVCAALPACCGDVAWTLECRDMAMVLCAECGCVPSCEGKTCGSDGCDGVCGALDGGCEEGSACDPVTGQCECVPDCDGKSCGDDGCGGTCGDCPTESCVVHTCGEGGTCTPTPTDCNDGDPCTTDGCEEDACTHTPVICDDSNLCTVETCNSSDGSCASEPVTDGTPCDDGNPNTTLDACVAGQCGCTPDCTDKQCGDDGCGGDCGACTTDDLCAPTACDITSFQCVVTPIDCDDDNPCTDNACSDGICSTTQIDCSDDNPCTDEFCFEPSGDCISQQAADGTACDDQDPTTVGDTCISGVCGCVPLCDGKVCGEDGCGGVCGTCIGQDVCDIEGQCICEPSCAADKPCGSDGCGGDCGACPSWEACEAGQCVCAPDCDGKTCGTDGCGGSCGQCTGQEACQGGACVCVPDCDGKSCGDDGCGGSCGACAPGVDCVDNQCTSDCIPDCTDKECGSNGCNGSCGSCTTVDGVPHECMAGSCEPVAECVPSCEGVSCGSDGCNASCGDCAEGELCLGGSCEPCTPSCEATDICGADGCGGTCGQGCAPGTVCSGNTSCVEPTGCDIMLQMSTPVVYAEEIGWSLIDAASEKVIATGSDYASSATYTTGVTLTTGTYILRATDSFGDGWSSSPDDSGVLALSYLNGATLLEYSMQAQAGGGYISEDVIVGVDCGNCVDSCDGRLCGPSGCGGTCGACPEMTVCETNPNNSPATQCVFCVPQCGDKECGQDECGGLCGETGMCDAGEVCLSGECTETGGGGPTPVDPCDLILANMPRLPLPADTCNAIAGVPQGNNVHHVSNSNPEWCPGCDPSTLVTCDVMPNLHDLFNLKPMQPGDVVLVHPGLYQVSDLHVPIGVTVRAVGGPTETTLTVTGSVGVVLHQDATLQGFRIDAQPVSTVTTFVEMLGSTSGGNANNVLEFNIIGGETNEGAGYAENAAAVRVRGQGSRVKHNTLAFSGVGVDLDAGVTLGSAEVTDNVMYDVYWPVQNHPSTMGCVANFCVGTSTSCTTSIDCSILMAPPHNHVFCSDGSPECTGADPLFESGFTPAQNSPLIGASTEDGKDLGAAQSQCAWAGCTSNCEAGGSAECTLEVFSFTAEEICSPVDFGDSPVRVVVDPDEVGANLIEACDAYTDLKEALDASSSGDVVLVYPGDYPIDDCSQSNHNGDLSALVVPEGVRLMSTHGAEITTLHIGDNCKDFMLVLDGATVEGFKFYGPSNPYDAHTKYVSIRGDDDTPASERFRFNVLYGEGVPFQVPEGSEAWGLQVHSTGATVTHNTFVHQMTGVEFTEPSTLETSTLKDNIFQDVYTPVRGPSGESDVSSTNIVYCPHNPTDGLACKLADPQLDDATFEPTEASETLVIGKASDGLDMGAVQVSCEWSITNPSHADGGGFDWPGCEQAPALTNGCAEQSAAWGGEGDQVLTDYGLCLDHDEMGGRLFDALTVADEENVTSIILGPGEWESCGLTLGSSVRVLSAMGPKHTQLVCKDEPASCSTYDDPDCPSAGVLELGGGSAALSGFNVQCLDGACKHDIPAIKMTGPDSILSHLIVTAQDSTGIEISLPEAANTAYLHLRHLTVVGNAFGMRVEHPTGTSYEKLQVNLFESVFAKNLFAITHLSSDVDAATTMGQSINAGNVLIGLSTTLGIDDQGHIQIGIPDIADGDVVLASYIAQHLNGIDVINTSSASEAFNQWADGGYQDANFSLPPELTELESADLGAIQEGCAWIEPVEQLIDSECAFGESECVAALNEINDAICIATYDLGFTFPDAISAGHYLRAVIANLVNDGVLEAVIRIGDGEWDVCTASSPTEFSENTVAAGLHIPAGYLIRADNGPSVTRITCPEIPAGAEPQEVVRIAPSGGLIGVDVGCGVLCDNPNTPAIRVALTGPPLGLGAEPLPALVSYVSATGGFGGAALQIES
ncbi:MAG: hypothetical protein ACPGU1_17935, partial [Myxococcota bacterium]